VDRELLERHMQDLGKGDRLALDGVFGLTSRGVYLLAYAILRNSEQAKDVLQETYVRVAENIGQYKPNTNANAWINVIARNLSLRHYNVRKRTVEIASPDDIGGNGNGEDNWIVHDALRGAMARLGVDEREIVVLFSIKGYKHREIAQIVGKPMGTVQWIYNRAIKKMKGYMEEGL